MTRLTPLALLFVLLAAQPAAAQNAASANWPLTEAAGLNSIVNGAVAAPSAAPHGGLVLRDYSTYPGPLGVNMQRWWLGGADWPVESFFNPSRYLEFVVGPVGDASFTATRIRMAVGSTGTSNFRAAIRYSTDPSFASATLLHDGVATRDGFTAHDFTVEATVPAGGNLYIRVHPYTNAGGSGRNLTIQNVIVDGETVATVTPDVTTAEIHGLTTTSAIGGGTVVNDGGGLVEARGVVWSTSPSPTLDDFFTEDGEGLGEFQSDLTGLTPGTTYYARAYATNRVGTGYGQEVVFATIQEGEEELPSVETQSLSRIRAHSARVHAAVHEHGGAPILARGVVWSNAPNPTLADGRTEETPGLGEFVSQIENLWETTTYYVRAYATNSVGTAYGEELTFTTRQAGPDFGLYGYATLNGGTTGGFGHEFLHEYVLSEHFPNSGYSNPGEALFQLTRTHRNRPSNHGLVIYVDLPVHENEFTRSKIEISDVENVSIIGVGTLARFTGVGFTLSRAHNIVMRNLIIHHVRQGSGTAIEVTVNSSNIWIDHNEFYSQLDGNSNPDFYDGLVDIKRNAQYITVSWNYFHDHWKTMLLGHTDNASLAPNYITYMNNRFRNLNSRLPLIRYADVHMLNNYFQDVRDTAINVRMGGRALVEGNYFNNVGAGTPDPTTGFIKGPVGWFYGSPQTGYWNLIDNIFVDTPHEHLSSTTDFMVPYEYDPLDPEEAYEQVQLYAGVGVIDSGSPLPVELEAFTGVMDGSDAVLRWTVASEQSNAGFSIEHRNGDGFRQVGFVEGRGTVQDAQEYSFRVADLAPGRHEFRLRQIDLNGSFAYSSIVELTVEVADKYVLAPPYPNPFNPQTTVQFAVANSQPVTVSLYDVLGRRVMELFNGTPAANEMQTIRVDGSGLTSGMYFVRLEGESFSAVRRVTLVK